MGLFGDILGTIGSITNMAGTGFEVWQGLEAMEQAEQMTDIASAATNQQMALAQAQWDRYQSVYGPLEEAKAAQELKQLGWSEPMIQAYIANQHTKITNENVLLADQLRNQDLALDNQWRQMQRDTGLAEQSDALTSAQIAEAQKDVTRQSPLRDDQTQTALAQSREARSDIDLYRPLKQAGVEYQTERIARDKALYDPLEDKMVADAANVDREAYARQAAGDVATAFDNARAIELREQGRLGVNPNSGRASETRRRALNDRALAATDAQNNARLTADDLAWNRQANMLNNRQGNTVQPQAQMTGTTSAINPNFTATSFTGTGSFSAPQLTQVGTGSNLASGAISGISGAGNAAANLASSAGKTAASNFGGAFYNAGRLGQTGQQLDNVWDKAFGSGNTNQPG